MPRTPSLRASDADRDAVAERLRQSAVEGRLEPHELEERLDTALRARTYGELDWLLRDLPGKPVAPARRSVPAARSALAVALRVLMVVGVVAAVLVVAAMSAAWWLLWMLVWLVSRAHGAGGGSRRGPARLGGARRA